MGLALSFIHLLKMALFIGMVYELRSKEVSYDSMMKIISVVRVSRNSRLVDIASKIVYMPWSVFHAPRVIVVSQVVNQHDVIKSSADLVYFMERVYHLHTVRNRKVSLHIYLSSGSFIAVDDESF